LLKNNKYDSTQKTLVGLNTPLHFAVLHENIKCIELLSRQSDISVTEKNCLDMTPIDLASLIPRKRMS
jgi:ankyrin repeat protein